MYLLLNNFKKVLLKTIRANKIEAGFKYLRLFYIFRLIKIESRMRLRRAMIQFR